MSYLQTLISHKNSTLAKAAQGAYVELLMCYRNRALIETNSDDSSSSVPGSVTTFLMDPPPRDALTPNQLSFRLKCLSILVPVSHNIVSLNSVSLAIGLRKAPFCSRIS